MSDYSWASVYWAYSIMAMFVVGAAFFLYRAVRSGAVSGDEAPKYRMLEDDDLGRAGPGPNATPIPDPVPVRGREELLRRQ